MVKAKDVMEKIGALVAVALFIVPAVMAAHPVQAVEGHTRFVDLDGFDPCLAAIAGLARMRVMWFNDVPLYERSSAGEGKYLYALEAGAPDPREEKIITSGEKFQFKDPNGHWWTIVEGYFDVDVAFHDNGGDASVGTGGAQGSKNMSVELDRIYVWIVMIHPDAPFPNDNYGDHPEAAFYNFVTMVDTCKFSPSKAPSGIADHANDAPDQDDYAGEHQPGYESHEHEMWYVDLWIGGAPDLLDVNIDPSPDGAWVRIGTDNSAGTTNSNGGSS